MFKKALSMIICFVMCFGIAGVIKVDAFATHYVTIKEGEEVWLDAGPYLAGQDVASWSFEWEDMQLTRYVEIVQKSSDWRRCKVRGLSASGNYVGRIYFNYKKWLSGLGMYFEDTVSFQITVTCNHYYGREEITKQPQLGVAGEKKCYCSKCGASVTKSIPALTKKDVYKPEVKTGKAYGNNNVYFVKLSPPRSEIDPTQKSIKVGNTKLYYMEPTGVYVGITGQMTADQLINNMQIVSGASEVIHCGRVAANGAAGQLTAVDFGLVKRAVLNKGNKLVDKQNLAADVNSDGVVSALDYAAIKRVVLKKDATFGM